MVKSTTKANSNHTESEKWGAADPGAAAETIEVPSQYKIAATKTS